MSPLPLLRCLVCFIAGLMFAVVSLSQSHDSAAANMITHEYELRHQPSIVFISRTSSGWMVRHELSDHESKSTHITLHGDVADRYQRCDELYLIDPVTYNHGVIVWTVQGLHYPNGDVVHVNFVYPNLAQYFALRLKKSPSP